MLVELGVVEQRYDAVKEVLERRGTVTEVDEKRDRAQFGLYASDALLHLVFSRHIGWYGERLRTL